VSTATTTFTFPTVTCARDNDLELMLFGLFVGVGDGSTLSFATGLAQCDHQSQPMIEGYVVTPGGGPARVMSDVQPGDTMVASFANHTAKLRNVRTGEVASSHYAKAPTTNLLVGALRGGASDTIPTFTPVPYKQTMLNGQPIGAASPDRLVLKPASKVLVSTSLLNPTGKGFTLTWKANS